MSITRSMHALIFAAGLLAGNVAAHAAQASSEETYEWSAELVSFDETSGAATLRAPVEEHAEIDFASFSEGERVTLAWTGRSWAAGVRDIARSAEAAEGHLKLPVEFVEAETDAGYVRFRVPVPEADAAEIASLMPGDPVRARSSRSAADWSEAVRTIVPYNAVL